jgi:hypothetical protein
MHDDGELQRARGRRGSQLALATSLLVGALVAGCALSAGAVGLGLLRPPGFHLPLGRTWLVAPCPAEMGCPPDAPYYAVWEGARNPDGSTSYELRFFTYLPRRR